MCIEHKGLEIVGAGAGRTTISWPDWGQGSPLPDVEATACWTAQESADAEGDPGTLADDVSGLFFLDPDSPVTVSGLSTRNHPANGIVTWGAHGFDVHRTSGTGHERYGVLAAASTDISIRGNVEQGLDRGAPWYSGTAGISVGDCWRHRLATPPGYEGIDAGWVPFHKLSQWLTYSLLEPFGWAGFNVTELDELTGLPEYRNGGLFLDFEVERGADGAMTGYAFPDMLVDVVRLSRDGRRDAAHDLFDAHLPLMRYEQQPGVGLAVRKHILKRRGVIASEAQRRPGSALTAEARAEVDYLLSRVARADPRARLADAA